MIEVCSNDQAPLTVMPYIFFFKIKNCLNDDLFISCDDRIGKMSHKTKKKKDSQTLFPKNRCVRAAFYFYFYFPVGYILGHFGLFGLTKWKRQVSKQINNYWVKFVKDRASLHKPAASSCR